MQIDLNGVRIDPAWTFGELTPKQTRYLTHGYYTYPAKFIPQLAARLVRELSQAAELVVDPFMGSGTLVVESILQSRRAVGMDINPVAHLVAKVKSTPLDPVALAGEFTALESDLPTPATGRRAALSDRAHPAAPTHERIDYWFPPEQKRALSMILSRIFSIVDKDRQDFFLIAFAQILKSCSIWLQRSPSPHATLTRNCLIR